MNNPAESYTFLAKFYDKLMRDCDYDTWSQYLYSLLKEYGGEFVIDGSGLDAACGSGNITTRLFEKGLNVTGFDISEEMLSMASQKVANGLQFFYADILNFKMQNKQSFINCSCDGLNYITQKKMKAALKNFYSQLAKDGVLMFDFSTKAKFENKLDGNTFFDEIDNVCCVWNNFHDKERLQLQMHVILFERSGLFYKRYDEIHTQYQHDVKEITQLLKNIGFSKVYAFDFLTTESYSDSDRVQFVAVK